MAKFSLADITYIIIFIVFSVCVGILIYRLAAGLCWVDSFYNATMVLSGCGPVDILPTNLAKILAGFYTLYGGIFFLVIIAIIFNRLA